MSQNSVLRHTHTDGDGSDDHGMNNKGNGLGLTIVKGIVERLGGEIDYKSRVG